jgi:hypothetical protein
MVQFTGGRAKSRTSLVANLGRLIPQVELPFSAISYADFEETARPAKLKRSAQFSCR